MPQQIINNNETGLIVRNKLNANFTELYGKANDLFNDATALEARVSLTEAQIASLDGRVTTNEGDISVLQNEVALLQSTSSTHTAQIAALDGRLDIVEPIVTTHTSQIAALDTRLDDTEGDIAVLQPLVTQHGIDIADIYATAAFTDQAYANPAWITSLSSNKLVGIIPLALIPPSAVERAYVYAGAAVLPWLAGLTTAQVQSGDTVIMTTDNNKMYVIVDDTKLNLPAGFQVYTAGAASSVPFTGITGLPTTLAGYGITDAWKTSSLTSIVSATIQGGVGKTDNLTFDRLNAFQITDTKSFVGSVNDLFRYSLIGATDRSVKLDATEFEVTYELAGSTSKISANNLSVELSNQGATLSKIVLTGGVTPKIDLTGITTINYSLGGDMLILDTASVSPRIVFSQAGVAQASIGYDGPTAAIALNALGTRNISFASNGATKMIMLTNGNFGIGTVAPTNKLHIINNASYSLKLESQTGGGAGIQLWDHAVTPNKWLLTTGVTNGTDGAFTIFDERQGQHRLVILPSGSVGIGTANPTMKLHVVGTTENVLKLDGASHSIALINSQTGFNSYLQFAINNVLKWDWAATTDGTLRAFDYVAALTRFVILPNGNVGIGTTAPQNGLHVFSAGAGARGVRIQSDATGQAALELINATGAFWAIKTDVAVLGDNALNFYDNATNNVRLVILPNGNVGIGVTNPAYRLDISTPAQEALRISSGSHAVFVMNCGAGALGSIIRMQQNGVNKWDITSDPSGRLDITQTSAPAIRFSIGPTGQVTIGQLGGGGTRALQVDNNGTLI